MNAKNDDDPRWNPSWQEDPSWRANAGLPESDGDPRRGDARDAQENPGHPGQPRLANVDPMGAPSHRGDEDPAAIPINPEGPGVDGQPDQTERKLSGDPNVSWIQGRRPSQGPLPVGGPHGMPSPEEAADLGEETVIVPSKYRWGPEANEPYPGERQGDGLGPGIPYGDAAAGQGAARQGPPGGGPAPHGGPYAGAFQQGAGFQQGGMRPEVAQGGFGSMAGAYQQEPNPYAFSALPEGYAPLPGGQGPGLPPDGSKKGIPAWVWVLALLALVGVIVGALFALGLFSDDDDDSDPTGAPTTTVTKTPTRSPTPSPTTSAPTPPGGQSPTAQPSGRSGTQVVVSKGMPAQVGDFTVEFLEFNPDANATVAGQGMTPKAGHKYVGVKLRVKNGSASGVRSSAVGVTFEGYRYEELNYKGSDGLRQMGTIGAGQSAEGWHYVELPTDANPTTFTYFLYDSKVHPNPGSLVTVQIS